MSSNTAPKTLTSNSPITALAREDPMFKYDLVANQIPPGFDCWCAIQKKWTTPLLEKSAPTRKRKSAPVDVEKVIECLVNPKKPTFDHPVPLASMTNVLVELWEAENDVY